MNRMLKWAVVGGVLGFLAFGVVFVNATTGRREDWIFVVGFSAMGGASVAAMAAVFAAFVSIKEELVEIRDDISRLRRIEDLITRDAPKPQPGPTDAIRRMD